MKKFEADYEDSMWGGPTFVVEARDITSARKKADREMKVCMCGNTNYQFLHIRELVPVERLEYETQIQWRDDTIKELRDALQKIQETVEGINRQ